MHKIITRSVSFDPRSQALECRTALLPPDKEFHVPSSSSPPPHDFKCPLAKLQSRLASLMSQLKDVRNRPCPFPCEQSYDCLVEVQDGFPQGVDRLQSELTEIDDRDISDNAAMDDDVSSSVGGGDVKVTGKKDKSIARCPIPFHIPDLPRPQDKFDRAVDNSNTPFKHQAHRRREFRANSSQAHEFVLGSVCLQSSGDSCALPLVPASDKQASKLALENSVQDVHPYEEDLTKMAYVEGFLDTVEMRECKSTDDTPFTFVSTLPVLKEMACKLQTAGELAVDLENHHYRSFQGFVCLMQVSTRDEDFVVDTIDLRSQIGPILGDIFSDPTIRKVMHGAEHDIIWLQRDFGIYVCNLFDTGQAARVLQLPGFGLAFLLEHFCGVQADKRYQLADWRIRPLPPDMLKYAREDTHYLLFVHDILKQKLLTAQCPDGKVDEKDPCLQVYKRSRDICLQLYSKDIFTETSYKQLCGFQEKKYAPQQLAVLAALYAWRDQISRKEDESTGYVLPNQLLFQLASEMPDSVLQLESFLKERHIFAGHNANLVVEVIHQAKEKSKTALQVSYREHEECKHRNEGLISDSPDEGEVGSIYNTVDDEEISIRNQIEGKKSETKMLSTILQPNNLASTTIVRKPSEDNGSALGATLNCREDISGQRFLNDACSEVGPGIHPQIRKDADSGGHETGQLELALETLLAVVTGRSREDSATVPILSSLISTSCEFGEILEAPSRPITCLELPTVNTLVNSDSPTTTEAPSIQHRRIVSWDQGQVLEQEKERLILETVPTLESEDTCRRIQSGADGFSSKEAKADRSGVEEDVKIRCGSWWTQKISAKWSRSICQIL